MRAVHVPTASPAPGPADALLRIGAAARQVGVSPSALRLWERQHLVRPARSQSGYRLYSEADIARLQQVRRMRDQQVNAPGIRQILRTGGGHQERSATSTNAVGRLRELRRAQGLSLRDASRLARVSTSFLSALERGATGASVGTLRRLTSVYGVTVLDLFAPAPPRHVVRTRERRALDLPDAGVRIEQLAEGAEQLEPQIFVLAAGADSATAYAHDGEEFLYVLEGELTFWIGARERHRLRTGDSLTFPSTLPHKWRNRADGETRLLWINTPPTF